MLSVLPDAVVTTLGTSVTIHVLANDSGGGLTVTSFSNPAHGSVTFNSDQSFTYTPTAGFVGADSFAYTVRDAQGTPSGAEVTITVAPNDGATRATDDYVEMIAGGNAIIPILSNDLTATGSLQIVGISVPGHGATSVLADQSIRYVPQTGFVGIDSFTYTVIDEAGTTASATVTVKVLAKNSPPLASGDAFTLEAGQTTVLAILANDSDPDGDPLQVVSYTMPDHGNLVFNPDRTFSYTPAVGYRGADQFIYTIRDNRGASASANVLLAIVETAERPTAGDDHVTTEAGVPVTIDVLGNDELPAGQEIRIVAVTLPFKGKLVFNLNGTITYTPNPGFVGIDDFTYTIGNGLGGTARATVAIDVMPSSIAEVYANGYAYRRRLAIPASAARGNTHENFPLRVELAGSWLKSTTNGGKVASADGHDLRFELADGTKLTHELEHYDAVTGELGAWVRLPELSGSAATTLLLYYDKPGLTQSEAEPAAVWSDYMAVWHLPESLDASGNGRSLAASGSVADTAEASGDNALSLDGNGVLTVDNADWLNGLSALTLQFRSRAATIGHDHGQFSVGDTVFGGNSDIVVRYQSSGFGIGAPQNVLHTKIKTTAGSLSTSSPAHSQTTDWQDVAVSWQSGDAQSVLYLDGTEVQPSFVNMLSASGTTSVSGPLYVGAGTQDSSSGGWVGAIDEVRLRASKLPSAWLAAEYANQNKPLSFYGMGAEEAAASDHQSIVAVPLEVATQTAKHIDIDVLSQAVVPAGNDDLAISGVSTPANGSTSIINGGIRYTPTSGFNGVDGFSYTLTANGKSSTAHIDIRVATVDATVDNTSFPNPLREINVNSASQLSAAFANAKPGDHIVLANGTYSGTFTTSVAGTTEAPIVVKPANFLNPQVAGRLIFNHRYTYVYGLKFSTSQSEGNVLIDADDCKVLHCNFPVIGPRGVRVARNQRKRFEIAYNYFQGGTNPIQILITPNGTQALNGHVHHNHLKGCSGSSIEMGTNETHSAVPVEMLVEYNLIEECGDNTALGFKCSNSTMFRNTLLNCGNANLQSRSGRNNKFIANACIGGGGCLLRGDGHLAIGNYKDNTFTGSWNDHVSPAGTMRQAQFEQSGFSGTQWSSGDNTLWIGNIPSVRIGGGSSTHDVMASNNRVEASPFVLVSGKQTGTTTAETASLEVPIYTVLTAADVGPEAGL